MEFDCSLTCVNANGLFTQWFPKGSTEPEDYNGGRDLDSLVKFGEEKSSKLWMYFFCGEKAKY